MRHDVINAVIIHKLALAGFHTNAHDIVVSIELVFDYVQILLMSFRLDELDLLLNVWLNGVSVRL
jgi:hypothetical protein